MIRDKAAAESGSKAMSKLQRINSFLFLLVLPEKEPPEKSNPKTKSGRSDARGGLGKS
jgi:hypothetical protein